jgi:hypothetical protein
MGRAAASVGHLPTGCERGFGAHEDDGAQGWRGPGAVADETSRVGAGMGALRGQQQRGRGDRRAGAAARASGRAVPAACRGGDDRGGGRRRPAVRDAGR